MNYRDILHKLCCPLCKSSSRSEADLHEEGRERLSCRNGHSFLIRDGIPDLRLHGDTEVGASNYSKIHSDFEFDRAEENVKMWAERLDMSSSLLDGKEVLIAGVGMGTELFSMDLFKPEVIVGIDYSDNVSRFPGLDIRNRERVVFLQADILNLPFKSQVFDVVFNSGVMQVLRSPELGFRQMHDVTKKGGILSIGSIYDQNLMNRIITAARWMYMFHEMEYGEAKEKLLAIGRLRRRLFKFKLARLAPLFMRDIVLPLDRMNQVMDYYYPEYRHIISDKEIRAWFADVGIDDVHKGLRQYTATRC